MFCRNCGNQMEPEAQFCRSCGAKVVRTEERTDTMREPVQNAYSQPTEPVQRTTGGAVYDKTPPPPAPAEQENNVLAIVGFALSFVVPFVGLILSAIGLKNANKGANHRGFAVAGVVISSIYLAMYVLGIILYVAFYGFIFGIFGSMGGTIEGFALSVIGALI